MWTYAGSGRARRSECAARACGSGCAEAGAQFTCFTGTRVQILTQLVRRARLRKRLRGSRCSVYLLYWYQSTNTDAAVAVARKQVLSLLALLVAKYKYRRSCCGCAEAGAQFTCFTGTTVQILTQLVRRARSRKLVRWRMLTYPDVC
jgi:hypothetical protein